VNKLKGRFGGEGGKVDEEKKGDLRRQLEGKTGDQGPYFFVCIDKQRWAIGWKKRGKLSAAGEEGEGNRGGVEGKGMLGAIGFEFFVVVAGQKRRRWGN